MPIPNIIIVNDDAFISGGAGKIALYSALSMREQGANAYLFSACAPVDPQLTALGVQVICTRQSSLAGQKNKAEGMVQGLWNRRAKRELERLLETLDPAHTVVHFHGWTKALSPALFAATKKRRFPVLITIHDYFLGCPNGGFYDYQREEICRKTPLSPACAVCNCDKHSYPQKVFRLLRDAVQNACIRGNDMHVAFITDFSRERIEPHLRFPYRWHELPNFFEVREGPPLQLEDNRAYLFVGRLSPEKGAELFCRALTDLDLPGILVGDGPLRAKLQAEYPNLRFTGWLDFADMAAFARQCRAMIFPSKWYETCGLVVPEVQGSYHMPCLVPDQCASRAFIEEGETGLLFGSGDLADLKRAIGQLERPGTVARMQSRIASTFRPEEYSLETYVERLTEIYRRILARGKTHTEQKKNAQVR